MFRVRALLNSKQPFQQVGIQAGIHLQAVVLFQLLFRTLSLSLFPPHSFSTCLVLLSLCLFLASRRETVEYIKLILSVTRAEGAPWAAQFPGDFFLTALGIKNFSLPLPCCTVTEVCRSIIAFYIVPSIRSLRDRRASNDTELSSQ